MVKRWSVRCRRCHPRRCGLGCTAHKQCAGGCQPGGMASLQRWKKRCPCVLLTRCTHATPMQLEFASSTMHAPHRSGPTGLPSTRRGRGLSGWSRSGGTAARRGGISARLTDVEHRHNSPGLLSTGLPPGGFLAMGVCAALELLREPPTHLAQTVHPIPVGDNVQRRGAHAGGLAPGEALLVGAAPVGLRGTRLGWWANREG